MELDTKRSVQSTEFLWVFTTSTHDCTTHMAMRAATIRVTNITITTTITMMRVLELEEASEAGIRSNKDMLTYQI